ncbi:MAG: glutathione S-transferase [Pseudomonadota bacterium]
MRLFFSDASPFARKVRIAVLECGLKDRIELVPVSTSPYQTDATLSTVNPLGKLPALERDDGPALYDSRVICRYIDWKAGAHLYPDTRIWDVLTLEATADGIMESALSIVYEGRYRSEDQVNAQWVDAQWSKIARALTTIESRWMAHLSGRVDAGQIALAAALGYLDLRLGPRNWRGLASSLSDWERAFALRPSMQETAPS